MIPFTQLLTEVFDQSVPYEITKHGHQYTAHLHVEGYPFEIILHNKSWDVFEHAAWDLEFGNLGMGFRLNTSYNSPEKANLAHPFPLYGTIIKFVTEIFTKTETMKKGDYITFVSYGGLKQQKIYTLIGQRIAINLGLRFLAMTKNDRVEFELYKK